MKLLPSRASPRAAAWLAVALIASVALLVWFGYRGVAQWQRSAAELASRRVEQAVALLGTAIARDMQGVQTSFLDSTDWVESLQDPAYELRLRHVVSRAFALYPYPETFFAWRGEITASEIAFFHRSDRLPSWSHTPPSERAPVLIARAPGVAQHLVDRILTDATRGQRYSIFDLVLNATPYQAITCLLYGDEYRETIVAGFGFMVNQHWVEDHYFSALTEQIGPIIGDDIALSVHLQTEGNSRSQQRPNTTPAPSATRVVPLAFFDPSLVALDPPSDLTSSSLSASATVINDPLILGARTGATRTLAVATVASILLALGLILSVRAARTEAAVTAMRSDFVSTATHELKTPLAGIRALAETLGSGRVDDSTTTREYAGLVVQEAKRLTRLLDNLLAYSRITDVTDVYTFESVDVDSLIAGTVQEFNPQLKAAGFDISVALPKTTLPPIRGDRVALGLLLDNLVDNAIHYSRTKRSLTIAATATNATSVTISVSDKGVGIPVDELEHVTDRGFRGRYSGSVGSGLGLSISRRIAVDHGGALDIQSQVNEGTTVSVTLPATGS